MAGKQTRGKIKEEEFERFKKKIALNSGAHGTFANNHFILFDPKTANEVTKAGKDVIKTK